MKQLISPWSIFLVIALAALPVQAQEDSPVTAQDLFEQALRAESPAEREDLLRRSLAVGESSDAYLYLGLLHRDSGDFAAAERELGLAFGLARDRQQQAEVRYWQGRLHETEADSLEAGGRGSEATEKLFAAEIAYRDSLSLAEPDDAAERRKAVALRLRGTVVPAEQIVRGLERGFGVEPTIDIRVNFDFDKHSLSATGRTQALELGRALSDPKLAGAAFTIIGHTDVRGTDTYNLGLSRKRAETVEGFLTSEAGIAAHRICTEGRGKQEPWTQGTTEDDHYLNRRVEVKVQSDGRCGRGR